MLGVSAEMEQILKIAKKKKIPICEDVCEAFEGVHTMENILVFWEK